jgi:hypothetical protein
MREDTMKKAATIILVMLVLLGALPAQAATPTRSTCEAWLATSPNPSGIPSVSGSGTTQRTALLASGSKLVAIGSRYYSVSIPSAFFSAAKPTVIFNLHGTGGYPEAEWNDWNAAMTERGHAFIALSWGGGTPSAATDTEIYQQIGQVFQEVGTYCPIAGSQKWLMGFSVGSAMSFAVMIRDVADQRLLRGQIAVSGAAIGPLTTGRDVMHSTVEANRSNTQAVKGTLSWMYCGEKDLDHTWSMCTEMPNGETFVNTHGGQATLYKDANGTHHSLPTNATARNQMFDYLAAAPASTVVTAAQADCLFDAAEKNYPTLFSPKPTSTLTASPYRYRYYSGTRSYLGVSTSDEHLYYLVPPAAVRDLGSALTFVDQFGCR